MKIKWIDINKGDGDRVESMSRLLATELKVHQVKMGILRDDVFFSLTSQLETVRLLMKLTMIESKQAKSYKLMFGDIRELTSIRHPEDVYLVDLPLERERSRCCGLLPKSMHGTRDATANLGAIVMDTLTNMEFEIGKIQYFVCTTTPAMASALPRWPARDTGGWNTSCSCLRKNWTKHSSWQSVECSVETRKSHCWIVSCDTDRPWMVRHSRSGRQTRGTWKSARKQLVWNAQKTARHLVHQASREAWMKSTRQTWVKIMPEHTEACAWESTSWLRTRGTFFCSHEDGEVDVSDKHHGVGKGKEMRSLLVGQADNVTEIREATSSWHNHVESRFRTCRVLENKKIHNRHCSLSRKAYDQDSVDDTKKAVFWTHAKSTSVQVWKPRSAVRIQVEDATRPRRAAKRNPA